MRPVSLVASVLICALTGAVSAADGLYGRRIVIEPDAHKQVRAAAEELASWLGQASGATFAVSPDTPGDGPAILLLTAKSSLVAPADAARLKDRGLEAFVIRSDGTERLWIVGNSRLAIQHGAHFYLDQLGCRWFLPNDHWKIVPSLKTIVLKIDRVESPTFRYRDFGGTGGFGGSLVLDPKRQKQAIWDQTWEPFNRMGGELQLRGHTGEAFNTAFKKELAAHPEFLAEIGGQRQPWSQITKLCGSNPAVRKHYIDWTLERFERSYAADPEGSDSWGVSVEPADGSGQCECAECNRIGEGSSTDKVFFLANEAAKALAAKHPGKKVSLRGSALSRCATTRVLSDTGYVRDWRCCSWPSRRIGFGGKNGRITFEQVADAVHALTWKHWRRWWHSWALLIERCHYYQWRNQASYDSRKRTAKILNSS